MFIRESSYARFHRKSPAKSRAYINRDNQRHWRVDERGDAKGISPAGRCVYAQNDAYLELCNAGWPGQWIAGMGAIAVVAGCLFIIWGWYGFAIHPLLFGKIMIFWYVDDLRPGDGPYSWFTWLVLFPFAIGAAFVLYGWLVPMGHRTAFFTYLRGRIRFNRKTRKVYVLRPSYCGGNKVFEWDRLVALMDAVPADSLRINESTLALYHPPFDPNDPEAKGEDCIFVGPELAGSLRVQATAEFWEYIRRYMEIGPTVERIPPNAPANYKQIPHLLPEPYSTYCGKPSIRQYGLEQKPGWLQTPYHMLSQITCWWPRFPKEWESDSGIGEPEDKPVQAGAIMTALVYRAQGRLSKADEIELMRQRGTENGLSDVLVRPDD